MPGSSSARNPWGGLGREQENEGRGGKGPERDFFISREGKISKSSVVPRKKKSLGGRGGKLERWTGKDSS